MSELGGAQISNLLETLPGIAQVLRSPVADAFVNTIRQASRSPEFRLADAEEILRYAVRRNLMTADESDKVLAEAQEAVRTGREKAPVAKAVPKAKAKAAPKAKAAKKPAARAAKAPVKARKTAKAPAKARKAAKPPARKAARPARKR